MSSLLEGVARRARRISIDRYSTRAFAVAAVAMLLGACSSGSSPSSGSSTTSGGAPFAVTVVTVPNLGSVLAAPSGRTLYMYAQDSVSVSNCSGGCAQAWPPLLAPAGARVVLAPGSMASGTLGVMTRADGTHQVTWNGMPLYTYGGDSGPGQANGNNMGGMWHVAAATPTSVSTVAPTTSPTTSPTTTQAPTTTVYSPPPTATPATTYVPPTYAPPVTSPYAPPTQPSSPYPTCAPPC